MTLLDLLDKEKLIKTGDIDFAEWNYRPLLGRIQRMRFGVICDLLGGQRFQRLLEVGYGGGIFMPELAKYCGELHGLDVHRRHQEVQTILAADGITAQLKSGSIEEAQYPDDYFDCIVIVSALEFVENLPSACRELNRICKGDGRILVVTPAHSAVVDLGFRFLTGEKAERFFKDRSERLVATLLSNFSLQESITCPPIIGRLVPLYHGYHVSVAA